MNVFVNYKGQTQTFPDNTALKDIREACGRPNAGVLKLTNANTLNNAINLAPTQVPPGTYDFVVLGEEGTTFSLHIFYMSVQNDRSFVSLLQETFRESLRNTFVSFL